MSELTRGLLDTSMVIDHDVIDPASLPDEFAAARAAEQPIRLRLANLLIASTIAANSCLCTLGTRPTLTR